MSKSFPNKAFISSVIGKVADEVSLGVRSNCFNAVQNCFREKIELTHEGPGEMLTWLSEFCEQVPDKGSAAAIFVVWSSDDPAISPDKIDIQYLATLPPGFPFGLRIEHAGVFLEDDQVFQ